MQQEPVDVWKVWEDNEAFHLLLASYADNQLLNKFLKESLSIQKRIYAQFSWNKKQSMDDQLDKEPHVGIYQALCDKDLEKAQELLLFYAGMSEGAEITASALQSETSLTLTGSQTYKNALLLKRLILRNRRLNLIVVNWKRIKLLAELSKC